MRQFYRAEIQHYFLERKWGLFVEFCHEWARSVKAAPGSQAPESGSDSRRVHFFQSLQVYLQRLLPDEEPTPLVTIYSREMVDNHFQFATMSHSYRYGFYRLIMKNGKKFVTEECFPGIRNDVQLTEPIPLEDLSALLDQHYDAIVGVLGELFPSHSAGAHELQPSRGKMGFYERIFKKLWGFLVKRQQVQALKPSGMPDALVKEYEKYWPRQEMQGQ